MNKIDWKRKLSSRKFWAAAISWLTAVLTSFGVSDNAIAQVSLIVSGIAAWAIYMLAESIADKARAQADGVAEYVSQDVFEEILRPPEVD